MKRLALLPALVPLLAACADVTPPESVLGVTPLFNISGAP